jgi:hypothetical protein
MPGGFWAKFIIVMAVIFVLGFFLDFIEIAVVVVPIVAPILLADPSANITAVWLGVMIGLNIQTSFLTPPFGFALFYLRGVAPASVRTVDIYKGVIAFICLQLIALGIVGYYPQLVNYLPNRMSLLGESSPPPRNPKLQICLEEYSNIVVTENKDQILNTIAEAKALDLTFLPKKISSNLTGAFTSAETALATLSQIFVAEKLVKDNTPTYRPLLTVVRGIESSIRRAENETKELKGSLAYLKSEEDVDQREQVITKMKSLEKEIVHLKAEIPVEWKTTYKTFSKLTKAENNSRKKYRRAADKSYEPVAEIVQIIEENDKLLSLEQDLISLRELINNDVDGSSQLEVKKLAKKFSRVKGASAIQSSLGKVARQLKPGKVKLEKALKEYEKSLKIFVTNKSWRIALKTNNHKDLKAYLSGISESIGARKQSQLTRKQGLYLAKCSAIHRDISLNF